MRLRPFTLRGSASPSPSAPGLRLVAPAATAAAGLAGLAGWAFATGHGPLLFAAALVGPAVALALSRRSARTALAAGRLALIDQLTGLGNDRHFLERLERGLDRAEVEGGRLTLCLIDADDFKGINDRFGHPAGDRVLAEVAACLRHGGEAFRLGGDEFALLLPERGEREGSRIARAVVRRIAEADHGHGGRVTASAGVATFPDHGIERDELVRAADAALYRAKRDGKDCVRAYRPDLAGLPAAVPAGRPDRRAALYEAAAGLTHALRARGVDGAGGASTAGDLAARVAARMGLPAEHAELIRLAGMLSDIGKLALPDDLLTKAGPLTEAERAELERHPQLGHDILGPLGVDPVALWVLHHHERWDGQGYPERLAGERIPLGARILFAADAYEAMTTDQAWRPRLTHEEALAELERCAGTQFDPEVVAAFVAEVGSPRRRELVGSAI